MYKVLIVDGTASALLGSAIFKREEIDICILEEKILYGYVAESNKKNKYCAKADTYNLAVDMLSFGLNAKVYYRCVLPSINFSEMRNLVYWYHCCLMHKKVKAVLEDLKIDPFSCMFFGTVNSAIMSFLPDGVDVVLLDHGTECVSRYDKYKSKTRQSNFVNYIYKTLGVSLLKFITGCTPVYLRNIRDGYTFASCEGDQYKHISIHSIRNDTIELLLKNAKQKFADKKNALVLIDTQSLYEWAMRVNGRAQYIKKLNYNGLYLYIASKLSNVDCIILKFHPMEFRLKNQCVLEAIEQMKIVCQEKGIECYTIEELVGCQLANVLPAEVYIRYLDFDALVTLGSTTSLNVASKDSKVRCINLMGFLYMHDEKFRKYSHELNPWIETIDVSSLNENIPLS